MRHLLLLTDEVFCGNSSGAAVSYLQAGYFSKMAQCVDWAVFNPHMNLTWKEAIESPGAATVRVRAAELIQYLSAGMSGDSAAFEDLPTVLSLSLSLRSPEGSHKPIIFSCVLHYLLLLWRGMLNLNEWDWACHLCACTSPFWLSRFQLFLSDIAQKTTRLRRNYAKRCVCSNKAKTMNDTGVKSYFISIWWKRIAFFFF